MGIQTQIPVWLQWAWALAGLGVALGGLLWILLIFWPYIRWSKKLMIRSLELGQETAGLLRDVQRELEPVIEDVREVVRDAREMVKEFRSSHDLEKVGKALDRLTATGALEDTLRAIQALPSKLDGLLARPRPLPGGSIDVPVKTDLHPVAGEDLGEGEG